MKLQLQRQSLRVRIDEAELSALLQGQRLGLGLALGGAPFFALRVELGSALHFAANGEWRLCLPEAELHDYVRTLPRREALSLQLDANFRLDFEVDVRDSLQVRGPRR